MWTLKKLEQELIEQGHLPAPEGETYEDGTDGISGGGLAPVVVRRREAGVDLRFRNSMQERDQIEAEPVCAAAALRPTGEHYHPELNQVDFEAREMQVQRA